MSSDYKRIREENKDKYGTHIGRIGHLLLAHRYGDRTHFIFELLQNAEDALARRKDWEGQRVVDFSLSSEALSVTHFGKPFDGEDVHAICGIAESTKDLTAIGRFGIGFKSVYAFTDSPEIHSGVEAFAIDSFVRPRSIAEICKATHATTIRLPFRNSDAGATAQILAGLQHLGPRTLLFLREIEEISWSTHKGQEGLYRRNRPEMLSHSARMVTIMGYDSKGVKDEEESWLLFSRKVFTEGEEVGNVEIAFLLKKGSGGKCTSVRGITDSPLVAFFPTAISTNLGFLVQGPYRTTPSRDNVPQGEVWNHYLVQETSFLLVDALRELRQLGLLDSSVLQSLPIDPARFPERSRFGAMFQNVREAFTEEPLLPRYKSEYISAKGAKLARTQELRDLIGPQQLKELYGVNHELAWISEDITIDRTPDVRRYLMEVLGVQELTPESLIPKLTESFLEAQPDEWVERLYVFLKGQPRLFQRLWSRPIVRLEDGSHVVPFDGHKPRAFLPSKNQTGFPTVRQSVCRSEDALDFLKLLGLSVPDLVDDVITNILPRYTVKQGCVDVPESVYEAHMERLSEAFGTDSTSQRQKLVSALRNAKFVRGIDAQDGHHQFVRPSELYLATQRLKLLFRGVAGVLIVDDSMDYLRGERIRSLLEASGCPLYLLPVHVDSPLTDVQKSDLRRKAGFSDITHEISLKDFTLAGLDALLETLGKLSYDEAVDKAGLLWEALSDVENRRGVGAFHGVYRWKRHGRNREAVFDAYFLRKLMESKWVPGDDGRLHQPRDVVFETTGWKEKPFLLTKIHFKQALVDELALKAGIEPEVITLLMRYGLTSVDEFTSKLRRAGLISDDDFTEAPDRIEDALQNLLGDLPSHNPTIDERQESNWLESSKGARAGRHRSTQREVLPMDVTGGRPSTSKHFNMQEAKGRGRHTRGGFRFISYVAVTPEEDEPDPDGLTYQQRIDLEEAAIRIILEHEPELERTVKNNPGFDLVEPVSDGTVAKLIEVKAMAGTLHDRPVGISRVQFEYSQKHGDQYWLYIVENAGDQYQSRLVMIQNPAGFARTFTFDRGWLSIARIFRSDSPVQDTIITE